MSCRMSPPKSASSSATSTYWVTRQAIRSETGSIAAYRSNWSNLAAFLLFVRSRGSAIMLRRSRLDKLKNFLALSLCLTLLAPSGLVLAQKPDDVVIKVDTRLVVLHATVVDKNGHLVTTLPRTAFQVFENGVPQQVK